MVSIPVRSLVVLCYMKQYIQTDLAPRATRVLRVQKRRINNAMRLETIASPSSMPEDGSGIGTEST